MNRNIVRRLEALEQSNRVEETPSLIMIHYDDHQSKWIVAEKYAGNNKGQNKGAFKENVIEVDKLQCYHFKPYCRKSRVIIDAFGNPDPNIHENLFCFDAKELWNDLEHYDCSLFIEAIRKKDDSIAVEVEVREVLGR